MPNAAATTTSTTTDEPAMPITGRAATIQGATRTSATADLSVSARRHLLFSLAVVWATLIANFQGLQQVLLAGQVRDLDPGHKVTDLALITTVSITAIFVAQPVVGAFSDRTRSSLGRRAPWMLAGAATAAAFLCGIGSLRSLVWIGIFWFVIQIALNVLQAPLSAVVADRFAWGERGFASAVVGIGTMVGAAAGVLVASLFANRLAIGYSVFGLAILAMTAAFVAVNRDRSSTAMDCERFRWRPFLLGFRVSRHRYPDFYLAFAARVLFVLGYSVVVVYQLYTLTDYVHLSAAEANRQIGKLSLALLLGSLATILPGGWLSDRLGRRKVFLYLASVLMGAGLVVPVLSASLTGMYVLWILVGMGCGLFLSVDAALMTDVIPDGGISAGKHLGLLNLANAIPIAAAPGLAALLINVGGGYAALFIFGIASVTAAAAVTVAIKSVR